VRALGNLWRKPRNGTGLTESTSCDGENTTTSLYRTSMRMAANERGDVFCIVWLEEKGARQGGRVDVH
jgi:hypothetical protein